MSKPVKILFILGTLDVGGAERHVCALAQGLNRTRWDPAVFVMRRQGPLTAELEAAGVRVYAPRLFADMQSTSVLRRMLRLAAVTGALLTLLTRMRPAIIHYFLPASYLIGLPISLVAGRPFRVMSRRSLDHYQRNSRWSAQLERVLHRGVTVALGNSRAVVRQLHAEGIPLDRLRLIYNGIDLGRMRATTPRGVTRRQLGIPDAAVVFTMVANLIPYKGHADLLTALAAVREQLPSPWRLLCVGRDDGIGPRLRDQSAALGLAGNVMWLGERRDIANLLSASDIGVLCSHEEGFSNAVLEGMASGLPMVVTDVGGNAEAVIDGDCGLVVPARNPARLGAALLQLATNPEQRCRLGTAARRRVESEFSLERCIIDYERLYEGLVRRTWPLPGTSGLEDCTGSSR